jgi:hypothetical protein
VAREAAATISVATTDDLVTMIDAAALDTVAAETPRWQHPCEATTDATTIDLPEATTTDLQEDMTTDRLDRTTTDLQGITMMEELHAAAEAATMIDEEATDQQQQADLQQHSTTDEAAVLQTTADVSETMRTDDPETTHHEPLRSLEDISLSAQSSNQSPRQSTKIDFFSSRFFTNPTSIFANPPVQPQ